MLATSEVYGVLLAPWNLLRTELIALAVATRSTSQVPSHAEIHHSGISLSCQGIFIKFFLLQEALAGYALVAINNLREREWLALRALMIVELL